MDPVIAWRNIWRNPRRTVLTVAAIAFACVLLVFMLSFQLGSYEIMIDAAVRLQTGHIQVQAQGYFEDQKIRQVVEQPAPVVAWLNKRPDVVGASTRASTVALISSQKRTYGGLVTGVDATNEKSVSSLAQLIREGQFLAPGEHDQALVGHLLARNLKVAVGDELTILGQGRDGSVAAAVVQVKGIYRSGQDAFDRAAIYLCLDAFREIFSMGTAAHSVVVRVDQLGDVEEIKAALSAHLATLPTDKPLVALDWQTLLPGLMQSIKLDLISGIIFYLILIMVVAFSILNTFLMAILERTREFGVLMAIGTKPGRLTRLVLMESAMMTVLGVVVGILLGMAVTAYFQKVGIDFSDAADMLAQFGISGRMYPRMSLLSVSVGPLAVLLITCGAALLPTWRIRKLRLTEALAYT